MSAKKGSPLSTRHALHGLVVCGAGALVGVAAYFGIPIAASVSYNSNLLASSTLHVISKNPPLDTRDYDMRLLALADVATSTPWYSDFLSGATSTRASFATSSPRITPGWPVRAAYPRDSRAILPFNRVVAYYGNFYSTKMGILGEFEEEIVLQRLLAEKADWERVDPTTPVVPAIEYIDVTAQGSAGKDGKYRLRMPDSQIDKALSMAKKVDGIVILDIQVGLSDLQSELPLIESYLSMPEVHLAIDPEFAMHNGTPPGRVIGSMDASDVNYAIGYLSELVKRHDLPPKILVVHRFTENMVQGYKQIKPTPEVQVVLQMDGWGSPQRKKNTYYHVVEPEPIQFTGLKIFYKNDLKEDPPRLLTKEEVLQLTPTPIFIQYQ